MTELPRADSACEVVFGEYFDALVVLRRDWAEELAAFRHALEHCATWGQLWSAVSRPRWQELQEALENEVRQKFWDFYMDLKEEEFFGSDPTRVSLEDAHQRYHDLPLDERWPFADDPFDPNQIWGFEEGDWPDWPQQEMLHWLPADVQGLGQTTASVLNGAFLNFEIDQTDQIVIAMARHGYRCVRDDGLVARASRC